jgi:hypothetical protein
LTSQTKTKTVYSNQENILLFGMFESGIPVGTKLLIASDPSELRY